MEPNNDARAFSQKIMEILGKMRSSPLLALKIVALVLVGIVVFAFAIELIGSSFLSLGVNMPGNPIGYAVSGVSQGSVGYAGGGGYAGEMAYDSLAPTAAPMPPDVYTNAKVSAGTITLSARNIASSMPIVPQPTGAPGGSAEDYTVAQYSATIETRHLQDTCGSITALKPRADVVFENANSGDDSCYFTFKVKHESVDEVLGIIKGLKPKYLSENEYTIEQQVQDYTSAEDSLKAQRDSIDETLAKATAAYDEVTSLATRSQNADALASIISSKINIIQQLTQRRVNINDQLEQLARSKAQQLDRIDYTYFSVNVTEIKFIDGKQLLDSWKWALQNFVNDLNTIVQGITLQFFLVLALVVQWALYALVGLLVIKYGWRLGKNIWLR